MKISLAKSAGFCFGVKRAIDIALKTASLDKNIYMFGDIVHNEDVVRQIEKAGIKKIAKLIPAAKNQTLLISAHGTCLSTLENIRALGYNVVDATCPMVKEIHNIVREAEKKGCKVLIIGDKKHNEVHGIMGQLKQKAMVIDDIKNIPIKTIKKIKKASVVAQSTQNLEKVLKIVGNLKLYIKDLEFFNTICRPTRLRQEEIRKMPRENDVMIIIGSKNSANTKRLYEISKSLNKRSYWISSKRDIKKDWLIDVKSVGITAGASTPDSTTQAVIKHIKQIG